MVYLRIVVVLYCRACDFNATREREFTICLGSMIIRNIWAVVFQEQLRTRTVDEYFRENPKVQEEIDDEIRNQNWA